MAATGHIAFDTIAMEDFGNCVRSVFENSTQWIGKTVNLSGDKMTLRVNSDYLAVLNVKGLWCIYCTNEYLYATS